MAGTAAQTRARCWRDVLPSSAEAVHAAMLRSSNGTHSGGQRRVTTICDDSAVQNVE